MKLFRRLCCVAAALVMVLAMTVQALGEKYTYTVRIYGGQQGIIVDAGSTGGQIKDNGDVLEITGLSCNDRLVLDYHKLAKVTGDSKYYVKGIRLSGRGTEEIQGVGEANPSFPVTRDQDYVIAYGVLTNPVEYTVNYRNAAGQDLAPSETYYGNVGDRPVVAYLYIEGYQPQAYNLSRTLSEDPAENVFTFVYSPLPDNTVNTGTTSTVTNQPGGGTSSTAGDTNSTASSASSSSAAESSDASSQPEENVPDNEVPAAAPPVESWNLDEGEVPLADYDQGSIEKGLFNLDGQAAVSTNLWSRIPLAAKIGVVVVLLGGCALLTWLLLFRRKEQEKQ